MDSAVAFNPAGEWDRPALIGYLGTAPPYVKGTTPGNKQFVFPGQAICFPRKRVYQVTFLPECAVTLLLLMAW
jgi:hypothetical protein